MSEVDFGDRWQLLIGGHSNYLERLAVPGGWLVRTNGHAFPPTFYPNPDWSWRDGWQQAARDVGLRPPQETA